MTLSIKRQRAHPFEDFDSTLLLQEPKYFNNPISQLLAQHLIFEDRKDGKFLPIPFPTGIGKTHNLIAVVHEAILHRVVRQLSLKSEQSIDEEPNKLPLFVFITNSVNNVKEAYDKLCGFIDKDNRLDSEQKKWLKSHLVYSPKAATSLQSCIEDDSISEILEIFDISNPIVHDNLAKLRIQLETLEQTKTENYLIKQAFEDNVEQMLVETFGVIFSSIVKKQGDATSAKLTAYEIEKVSTLIPAIKMEYNQAQAVFLTTSKFLFGVHQTKGKYHFVNDMGKHSLVIDEIDRQNDEILGHLVKSVQNDLLSKAKTIHSNLQFSDLCRKPQYHGITDLIADYTEGLTGFITKHRLHLSFNMADDLSNTKPNPLLFSDKLATHFTNINKPLYFSEDSPNYQNLIFTKDGVTEQTDENDDSNLLLFSPFLNELDQWANKRFNYLIMNAVEHFKKNTRGLNEEADDASSQVAIASILHQLNLYELQGDILQQLRVLSGRKHAYQGHDGTYHTRGISLIEIDRPPNTKDSVVFYHHGFEVSPTGMIANYVEQGATVIGVSATATCKSVIHNFDIDYLSYRLGEHFIALSESENQSIADYYHMKRNYKDNSVILHTPIIENNVTFLLEAYCSVKYANQISNIDEPNTFERTKKNLLLDLNLIDDSNKDSSKSGYKLIWLNKLCQAIEQFYHSIEHGNRYMMAMLNRFLNKETREFLDKYIKTLDKQYSIGNGNIQTKLFSRVNAHYLKTNKFENEVRATLSESHNRVIVLTTYQTLASGANPDYEFAEWESDNLKLVAPTSYGNRTDIDTMYLEKCTHIISADDKPQRALESRLTLLAQGMALKEAGQLSEKALYNWTHSLIESGSVTNACKDLKNKIYNLKNSDYISACCRDIEQAIGRSNRTAHKRPHIYLMYDEDLIPILAQDNRPNAIVSHEYRALVDDAKEQYKLNGDNISSDDRVTKDKRLQSMATKVSARTNKHINTLLKNINELSLANNKKRQTTIENWKQMRDIIAVNPNHNNKPMHPNGRYYLELPEPKSGYQYSYENETNFGSYRFFDQRCNREVSERDCRLDVIRKNPVIANYFKQKGYATHWSVNANYVMTPPMFTNIYKGFLGEACGTAILEHYDFRLSELSVENYEVFDNIISYGNQSAWIDFKHWDKTAWGQVPEDVKRAAMNKFVKKIDQLSQCRTVNQPIESEKGQYTDIENQPINKLVICNLMDDLQETDQEESIRYYDADFLEASPRNAKIMTISGIIDSKDAGTNLFAVNALKQWLSE